MPSESPSPRSMPDVAGEIEPHRAGQLEWVGMDGIEGDSLGMKVPQTNG